jgi:probable F420-dependent oxidoreductase
MRVYATMSERMGLAETAQYARRVEAIGYDGLLVPEAVHDGLLISMAALSATRVLRVTTSVLVVFPRSPMTTAHAAWDLQEFSGGRFELGLGTQVRGNIIGRYSSTWDSPVSRMREYVESLKAIFHSFQTGEALGYAGEHYQFSRLQPFFNPGPLECPPPPIHLGAVGPDMTRMAGGTADGLMSHPTNSAARVLAETTLPRVAEGALRRNRNPKDCPVMVVGFIVTGSDEAVMARNREWVRKQFAFLYSTPAYWPSLELLGFREVGRELNALSKRDCWKEMERLVSDEMIEALVPQGRYADIARILLDDYARLVDRITFPVPDDPADDERAREVLAELHEA